MFKIIKSIENTRLFNIMLDSYLRSCIFDIKMTKDYIFFSVENNDIHKVITQDEGSENMVNFINMLESVDELEVNTFSTLNSINELNESHKKSRPLNDTELNIINQLKSIMTKSHRELNDCKQDDYMKAAELHNLIGNWLNLLNCID